MNRIALLWNHLRATFWFLPSILVATCAALAIFFIYLDTRNASDWLPNWPLLLSAQPDGARVMLSTIAGSMMTVVGVTYSMILVTLSLAASQYSSRIIRNFMRDRATQIVLGIYTGTFVYCLLVLRVIPADEPDSFVPVLAVTFGVVLALGGVGMLIYFIHHIAAAIQASSVIAAASRETLAAIDRCFPPIESIDPTRPEPLTEAGQPLWHPVHAEHNGYIQSANNSALIALADKADATIRMERAIGDFIVHGQSIASIAIDPRPSEEISGSIRAAFTINSYRTVEQDPAYGIQQIVDIALRALSPSMNDTNTATMCVDHLSAALARLATRAEPPTHLPEGDRPRLLICCPSFGSILDGAFNQIRESAEGNAAILLRMLGTIQTVARLTEDPVRRSHLNAKLDDITEAARRSITAPTDLQRFERRLNELRSSFTSHD